MTTSGTRICYAALRICEVPSFSSLRSRFYSRLKLLSLVLIFFYSSQAAANVELDESYQPAAITSTSQLVSSSAGGPEEFWSYVDIPVPADHEYVMDSIVVQWSADQPTAVEFREFQQEVIPGDSEFYFVRFSALSRFLSDGTILISATAFSNDETILQTAGANEVVFTFNIEAPYSEEEEQGSSEEIAAEEQTPTEQTDEQLSSDVPLTINQRVAQAAMNSVCDTNTLANQVQTQLQETCSTVALMADPRTALDRVVPEEIFSIADTLTRSVDQQLDYVQSRIMAVRAGQRKAFDLRALRLKLWDQTIPTVVLSQGSDTLAELVGGGASADGLRDSAIGVFTNGNISVGEVDGDGIQRNADISSNHLTIGADYRPGSNRVIGAALSIASDDTDFQGDNGALDMQGFGLSAFASWYKQDKGYADIIVDISRQEFDLTRRINMDGQADEFANGSTDATRFTLAVNLGRTIQRGANEFGPVARISIMQASVGQFTESSTLAVNAENTGAGTALRVDSQKVSSARFAVGGEFKRVVNTKLAVFVPSLRLLLDVENQTEKDAITASFVNDIDASEMRFGGAERDSMSLLLNLGTTAVLRGAQSAFVNFQTRMQDDRVKQSQVRIGYRMHF
jgi:outer membrane autotransporter protein